MASTDQHRPARIGRRRPFVASAGLALGLVGALAPVGGPAAQAAGPPVTYLVQLVDAPLAGYVGDRAGLAPTRPRHGARLDRQSAAVRRYRGYLDERRREVLRRLPGVRPLYTYRWTVNGFAAELTPDQVAEVRRTSGVRSVTRDSLHHLDALPAGAAGTDEFLGLPKAWSALGGRNRAGAGVVIGVVDSGIWPDHPSFAGSRPAPAHPFTGGCAAGFECKGAVLGARWYLSGLGSATPVADEFRSARDYVGHGTHVAAVAAGDAGVPAAVGPQLSPTLGTVAGVAPAAGLAVYKSCWSVPGGESCAGSDTVAAVDQAVADGVDVLNISLSGASAGSPGSDPLAAALYGAAEAGVFVTASAGNNGPDPATAHGQPWLTTVGASTFDRRPVGVARLGNGTRLSGAGLGAAVGSRPLITGAAAGSRRCANGRLDPAKVRGRIVVCIRGGSARIAKSAEVARAGGVGMILANPGLDEVDADQHAVPTVHIDSGEYEKLAAYLKAKHPTASLEPARMRGMGASTDRPQVAEFSARGPDGDVLAPDLIAPGVDVPAGVSPAEDGSKFALRSGTSVATPQVAGAAALLRSRFADWTPMAVKSALLTTASTTDVHGAPLTTVDAELAGPAEYGAGALRIPRAVDPGLVLGSTPPDWSHTSAVNSPAIAIGALAGVQIVRRTVTNVGSTTASYVAKVEPPPGVDVDVSPARLGVAPGASATFAVRVHRISAPYDQLASGSITWTDGKHAVRMPIAVRPVVVAAASGAGLAGPLRIVPGFSGQLRARLAGPVPAAPHRTWLRRPGPTATVTVNVPEHTALARFATSSADYPPGTDVDLAVYRKGELVQRSIGHEASERIDLSAPEPGKYQVRLRLVSAPGEGPLPARFDSYVLPTATVEPKERGVRAGTPALVRLSWPDRPGAGRWLGQIQWSDGGTGSAVTNLSGDVR